MKMVKEIILDNGMKAKVDDEDYDWLMKYKWNAIKLNGSTHAFTIIDNEAHLMENMIINHALEPYKKRNMK